MTRCYVSPPCDSCVRAEHARLTRWKAEATAVIDGWERLWHALGQPGVLGQAKSQACLDEIERMKGTGHSRIHLDYATDADARRAATAFRLLGHTVIDNNNELIITRG